MVAVSSIVVGTDFSKGASRAVSRAKSLAGQLHLRLVATHIVPGHHSSVAARDAATAEALAVLESSLGVSTPDQTPLVRVGAPHEELARAAESENARVIVVGVHHSRNSLENLLVGSTAERVLRTGHCAVLLARLGANRDYRTVLVPVDLSDSTPRLLQLARDLFPSAHLLVVHCMAAAAAHEQAKHGSGSATAQLHERMEQFVARAGLDPARCTLHVAAARDPRRRIVELAKFHEADVIAMGTHARSGLHRMLLGSTADHVVRAAHCDVLVQPPAL
jgi:nucleotide-binding universal stress UspA family protein